MPISSAIFVPLTTTIAWPISRRTIRPRRTSVALCTDGRLRVLVETGDGGNYKQSSVETVQFAIEAAYAFQCRLQIGDYKFSGDGLAPNAGVARKLISTAVAECVSAPTEMKSTPVSA